MHWQDWVLTIGQIIFIIALIPTIRSKEKPSLATSIPTGIILITFAFSYFTLSLWSSSVMALIMAASWLLLAFQKYNRKK